MEISTPGLEWNAAKDHRMAQRDCALDLREN
jgi:hypothetical protein